MYSKSTRLILLGIAALAAMGGLATTQNVLAKHDARLVQPTASSPVSQTWYVKLGGDDTDDCLTPQTACATLQGPLAKPGFLPGDTVRAAVGVYTGTDGATAVVLVSQGAYFSGGWDANAFEVQQDKSVVDGQDQVPYGFWLEEGTHATIDHFVIKNCGTSPGHSAIQLREAGSISISNSTLRFNEIGIDAYGQTHVTVVDSVVSENRSVGIFVSHYFSSPGGSLLVDNCTVERNGFGGIQSSGTTTITHSLIAENVGDSAPGIRVGENSVITDNRIIGNVNEGWGGGLVVGGSDLFGATIYVARNEIRGNVANEGAGLGLGLGSGPATTTIVEGNLIVDNATTDDWCGGGVLVDGRGAIVRNNIIANNTSHYGGGICTYGGNPGESWIINNTIVDNEGDGIYVTNPHNTVMRLSNNIIAGNSNRGIVGWNEPDAQTVAHNLVWGNSRGNYMDIANMTGIDGNISQPPLLVNRFGGPWYLGACSPAIDAGTDQNAPPFDFEGDARPFNNQVDIGADEWTGGETCFVRYLPLIRRR